MCVVETLVKNGLKLFIVVLVLLQTLLNLLFKVVKGFFFHFSEPIKSLAKLLIGSENNKTPFNHFKPNHKQNILKHF